MASTSCVVGLLLGCSPLSPVFGAPGVGAVRDIVVEGLVFFGVMMILVLVCWLWWQYLVMSRALLLVALRRWPAKLPRALLDNLVIVCLVMMLIGVVG